MASFQMFALLCVVGLSRGTWAETEMCRGPCSEGWVYHNWRCFRYFPTERTWMDAEADCISFGGNLAPEHSEKDHRFLKALQRHNDRRLIPFWIGLSDRHQEGTWMWTDGSVMDYTKWIPGQPDNFDNDEHCVHSDYGHLRDWNDVTCGGAYPYICAVRLLNDFALHGAKPAQ